MDIMEYTKNTFNMYFGKLEQSYKYIEKNATWKEVFIIGYVISLISAIISSIISYLADPAYQTLVTNYGTIFILGMIAVFLIITPLAIFASYGILYGFFKLFDGKASYTETIKFGLSCAVPYYIVVTVLSAFGLPLASNIIAYGIYSIIVGLASFGFMIWMFIISVKVYSKLHKITTGKALLAMILPIIIVFVLMFTIGLLIGFFYAISMA